MTAISSSAKNHLASRRMFTRAVVGTAAILTLLGRGRALRAQTVGFTPLVQLGSDRDERFRLDQLLGQAPPSQTNILIRSTSRFLSRADTATRWQYELSLPEERTVHNSSLPFSLNDGPLWAGRGWNESFTAGLTATMGRTRIIVAPTLVSSDNQAFQVIPFPPGGGDPRVRWANPFYPLPESIDLPIRFGDRRLQRLDLGQSSLTVDVGPVSVGAGTENLWWGPGIQNAITISNNAPGVPHVFIQAKNPIHTRVGTFDAQWILGRLAESEFFDPDSADGARSLNGAVGTWTTPFDTSLTIGFARIVMGKSFPVSAVFDVLRSAGHFDVNTSAPLPSDARDQISSLFARWLFPQAGFEAYAEWARFEEPLSLRDFLEYPEHSEGYTLGFQWAHPLAGQRSFRLQSEATYLAPDPSLRLRPTAVTYTSRAVQQGFTEEGQMLGAAIGPGSSSQWLAGEMFAPRWRIGPYLERISWDTGTMEESVVPLFKRPDVTLLAGVRAGASWHGVDVLVDFAHAARFNYLFQTYVVEGTNDTKGIDIINNTLSVTLSTAVRKW